MNIDQYLPYLDNLSEYRRVHSLNVAEEAVRYAKKYGIDHKKPKTKGGTDKNSNLRATHIECNEKRKDN